MIKNELGDIRGISLFPSGPEFMNFAYKVDRGPSKFLVTVRGSKAIKDMEITLYNP